MTLILVGRRRGTIPTVPITLTISRQDGGSGSTLVNTGIPLAQGELLPGNVGNCSLWINGSEVACYLEALRGTHVDGSVQWMLVQWTGNPATVSSCELRINGGSSVGRAAKVTPPRVPNAYFVAPVARLTAAPRKPFKTVPVGSSALPSWLAQWDSLYADRIVFERTQSTTYQKWENRLGGAAPYDFGATCIKYGMRSANALYWHHTLTTGQDLTTNSQSYSWVSSNVMEFSLVESWSWVWCYWLTGNTDYIQALAFHTRRMVDMNGGNGQLPAGTDSDSNTGPGDNRLPARALDGYVASMHLGVTTAEFGTSEFWAGANWLANTSGMAQFVTDIFTIVTTAGRWGGTVYTESATPNRIGQKPFMVGMLLSALARHDDLFGDSRTNTKIAQSIAVLRTDDWSATPPTTSGQPSFSYVTYDVNSSNARWNTDTNNAGGDNIHGLNNFHMSYMLRQSRIAADTELRNFVQTFVNACYQNRTEWINQSPGFATKQFDEAYVYLFEAQREFVEAA